MHTPHVETLVVISFALSASVNKLDLRLQSERRQNTMGLLLDTFCISKDLLSESIWEGSPVVSRSPRLPRSPYTNAAAGHTTQTTPFAVTVMFM